MDSKKKFQELTIRDNFMFAAVMMQDDNCKHFLEMLLGIEIREVKLSYEKCIIFNPEYKGVRLDVYAADENNTRYDIEMQIAPQQLGKRARYYHSQMDMELLESGHDYEELPEAYVIFVCDFDPFGREKYCYTFENRCLQDLPLAMEDNSRSIFLSTKGKDSECIPKELLAFLDFVRNDNEKNDTETDDAYVKDLQRSIHRVKNNRKLERSFMSLDDFRKLGIKEGKLQARREIVLKFLSKLGEVPERLQERIMSVSDFDVLDIMIDNVVVSASIEEFEEKISNL